MKILAVSDEECRALWDYYTPGKLADYDLILSCGDLKAQYLEFLVTMSRCPVLYVHGNHDGNYDRNPPQGCVSIEDKLIVFNGVRILGLGGCRQYHPGPYQYTEAQMRRRIRKLRRQIKKLGGVDIVLTHAAPFGVGDWDDRSHRGFEAFLELIDSYHPKYMLHGHVHLSYGYKIERVREYSGTHVINCCEKYELDYEYPNEFPPMTAFQRWCVKKFVKRLEIIST